MMEYECRITCDYFESICSSACWLGPIVVYSGSDPAVPAGWDLAVHAGSDPTLSVSLASA